MRVGIGYDTHRLVRGRKLVLGGIEITHPKGLLGHSDGDVLAHAIIDAILGAAALPDIGQHFPDTDPLYKDANSLDLLATVREEIRTLGFQVQNIDATVIAEQPKLIPHVGKMRLKLARTLELDEEAVGIKAKTREGLGDLTREEAIACLAVALLEQKRKKKKKRR